MTNFGELLRTYRLTAGLSQEALAERAGLSAHGISDLERGARRFPHPDTVQRLVGALGLLEADGLRLRNSARHEWSNEPPPRTHPEPRLPAQPTPLIGREHDVEATCDRLRQAKVRLLSLTGPGGVGKTRLAIAAADELVSEFPDGVWFVDLAPVQDAGLVIATIADVLGVRDEPGHAPLESVQQHVQARRTLLVLDNFEHVLSAAPGVGELLAACAGLKVLATSREALRLRWEHVFPVPPLAVAVDRHVASEDLERVAAVELFIERAKAADATFTPDASDVDAIAALTSSLDGLPLAIELAAARVHVLPPRSLLTHLSSRLNVLTGGLRDGTGRHQTLRAAIDWSDDLLDVAERRLFHRLAVNAGGWSLDATQPVCNPHGDLGLDPLEGLVSLADKNLITRDHASLIRGGDARFGMLETIREYALERFQASGEVEEVRSWHASYYLALAESAASDSGYQSQQSAWLDRVQREHDNMRAALAWATDSAQHETAIRLVIALTNFWLRRGHLSEGRRWLGLALSNADVLPSTLRAGALHAAGVLAQYQSDFVSAESMARESLDLYRALDDRTHCVAALQALARVARMRGNHTESRQLYEESLSLATETGDRGGTAQAQLFLAVSWWWMGDGDRARPLLGEALTTFQALGDLHGIADALNNLAWIAHTSGDYSRARQLHADAMTASRTLGDQRGIARTLHGLGALAMDSGEIEEASVLFEQALERFHPLGERWFVHLCILGLAMTAHGLGSSSQAAQLLGAASSIWDSLGASEASRSVWNFSQTQATADAVRLALGEREFEGAYSAGRSMSAQQALELVRQA